MRHHGAHTVVTDGWVGAMPVLQPINEHGRRTCSHGTGDACWRATCPNGRFGYFLLLVAGVAITVMLLVYGQLGWLR